MKLTPSIKIRNFYIPGHAACKRPVFLILFALIISFCSSSSIKENHLDLNTLEEYSFPYRLDKPDSEYKLPGYLEEISGLSYYQEAQLACVQDEKAVIYIVELRKDLKITPYKFGKDGDFEDIAVLDQTAYVLRNDGRIFRVKDFRRGKNNVEKFETGLSEINDTEGLAYDPLSNSLLIACKGLPSIEKDNPYSGSRAVYRFDLTANELISEPYLLIDLSNLNNYSDKGSFSKFSAKLAKNLRLTDSETSFKPSGISIHPLSGDLYMISYIGKLLVVLNKKGEILYINELDDKLFRQPEGICFSPEGDLFISNEGQGGK